MAFKMSLTCLRNHPLSSLSSATDRLPVQYIVVLSTHPQASLATLRGRYLLLLNCYFKRFSFRMTRESSMSLFSALRTPLCICFFPRSTFFQDLKSHCTAAWAELSTFNVSRRNKPASDELTPYLAPLSWEY